MKLKPKLKKSKEEQKQSIGIEGEKNQGRWIQIKDEVHNLIDSQL